jgi:hypothetical protein
MPTVEVLFTEEEELLLLTVEAADNVFTVIKPAIQQISATVQVTLPNQAHHQLTRITTVIFHVII